LAIHGGQLGSLGIQNVNKKKHILWCRGKLHWTVNNQWRKVVYADEMMIVIKPDGKLKVWRKASEKWRPECLEVPCIVTKMYSYHWPNIVIKCLDIF
jgi:hypothetical protein